MRRAELASKLALIPPHPKPDAALEQYTTPAEIAAEWLLEIATAGELRGRIVDLGCGTGVLAIGAALLGGDSVEIVGVDVDGESLYLAAESARRAKVDVQWREAEVAHADLPAGSFDVCIMNPPFGAQKANRRGDRAFYEAAARLVRPGGVCWFLAPHVSEGFLGKYLPNLGGSVERRLSWEFPLPARMEHHSRDLASVPVGAYRWQRRG